jgi:hypothetical protein
MKAAGLFPFYLQSITIIPIIITTAIHAAHMT